jgi:pimeloyl-ACP methyl ester carboxylesterase
MASERSAMWLARHEQRARIDGAELRYVRVGSGAPVVFVHTLRTQLEMFLGVMEELDTARVEAIAVDLPGHGRSTAPSVEYTANYFSNAVAGLLDQLDLDDVVYVGESIGASVGLILAARRHPRVLHVVAINPYDYGRWGGIRRSSPVNNMIFTAILWPGLGPIVARAGTTRVLRTVMAGGLYDRNNLPPTLAGDLARCGRLPGHARAFRSLCQQWRSWIAAREEYGRIQIPVTLVYGDEDWSRPIERDANASDIPDARTLTLPATSHFASLEQPKVLASLIHAVNH